MLEAVAVPAPSALSAITLSPNPRPSHLMRVDTLDLKAKLADALGNQGQRYWKAFIAFCTAAITRDEFEQEAVACLKPQHVHLHNALVLGILYNATSGVPGPSAMRHHHNQIQRAARTPRRNEFGEVVDGSDEESGEGNHGAGSWGLSFDGSPRKRLRNIVAGLSSKERKRLKALAKPPTRGAGGAAGGVGWAGAGADMLEKKRRDEERRRTVEERRRFRQHHTQVGMRDWKTDAVEGLDRVRANFDRLPAPVQQSVMRALAMPSCSEARVLPDAEGLQDVMSLQAVEAGLNGGTHPQAAALVLAALQDHLQNIAGSVISRVRANRQGGIRTSGPNIPAAQWPPSVEEVRAELARQRQAHEAQFSDDSICKPKSVDDSVAMDVDDSGVTAAGVTSSYHGSPAVRVSLLPEDAETPPRHTPLRPLRNMASDLSARTSASALSTAGGLGVGGNSFLTDASVVSGVSTAPTSVLGGASASGSAASFHADKADTSLSASNHSVSGGPVEDTSAVSISGVGAMTSGKENHKGLLRAPNTVPSVAGIKRHRDEPPSCAAQGGVATNGISVHGIPTRHVAPMPSRCQGHASGPAIASSAPAVSLDDMDFLFDVAPHTVVEPLGQLPQMHLLRADWESEYVDGADGGAVRRRGDSSSSGWSTGDAGMGNGADGHLDEDDWDEELEFRRSVRRLAASRVSTPPLPPQTPLAGVGSAPPSAAASPASMPPPPPPPHNSATFPPPLPPPHMVAPAPALRSRFLVDQTASARLLDRRTFAETMAAQRKGGKAGGGVGGGETGARPGGTGRPTKGGLSLSGPGGAAAGATITHGGSGQADAGANASVPATPTSARPATTATASSSSSSSKKKQQQQQQQQQQAVLAAAAAAAAAAQNEAVLWDVVDAGLLI